MLYWILNYEPNQQMLECSYAGRTHSSAGSIDASSLQSDNESENFLYQSCKECASLLQQNKAKYIHTAW